MSECTKECITSSFYDQEKQVLRLIYKVTIVNLGKFSLNHFTVYVDFKSHNALLIVSL